MDLPVSAYKGDQPYLFVCYAHEDKDLVYSQIRWLHEQGVNVWYDEGLSPGEEWTEELGSAIEGAQQFIYFVTPASVASRNCRNEVHLAQKHGKPMLAVHLQDTQLPAGLELTIGTSQAILKNQMSETVFRGKLLAALKPVASVARHSDAVEKNRWGWRSRSIVATLAALTVASGVGWWWFSKSGGPPIPQSFDRSVTVRPFSTDDGNPSLKGFANGLRNDVNGILAGYPELRTVANEPTDPQTGGSRRAAYAVEGGVQAAGAGAAIRLQLVRTADLATIWSERFTAESTEGTTDESALATLIARFIRLQLVQDQQCQSIHRKTSVTEAADATCAAMVEDYKINQGGAIDPQLERALSERAIELDPGLADAYVYLALTSSFVAGPRDDARRKARDAADHAVSIEKSPMTLFARALVATNRLDYDAAEADLREAIRLDPLHPNARWFHGGLGAIAVRRGNVPEALEHYRRAIKMYDADARIYQEYAYALFCAGELKSSIDAATKGLELTTTGPFRLYLLNILTRGHVALGESATANEFVDGALASVERRSDAVLLLLGIGRLEEAHELWDPRNPAIAAFVHTAFGQYDQAIDSWHHAIDGRSLLLGTIRTDPAFTELRKDPRWPDVMRHLERVENEARESSVAAAP